MSVKLLDLLYVKTDDYNGMYFAKCNKVLIIKQKLERNNHKVNCSVERERESTPESRLKLFFLCSA